MTSSSSAESFGGPGERPTDGLRTSKYRLLRGHFRHLSIFSRTFIRSRHAAGSFSSWMSLTIFLWIFIERAYWDVPNPPKHKHDPQIGFILVGSEKMEYVLSCQGDALNKFASIAVDYFDKRTHWADFQDLIKRPTASYLEFSESAIDAIYEECAGNPFYAKLICRDLFALMVERRDGT